MVDRYFKTLIYRGDCYFVTKVRNAEQFGATAVIVVNNRENQDAAKMSMADNGSGRGIKIPSLFISLEDGKVLKDYFEQNPGSPVDMYIQFETVRKYFITKRMLKKMQISRCGQQVDTWIQRNFGKNIIHISL
jgi:hypothetical protein